MRQFIATTLLAVALTLGAAAPVFAASVDGSTAPKLSNMSVDEFLAFHTKLSRDLTTRKYDYVNSRNRERIAKQQEQIRGVLAGHQSMSELDDADRTAVFNAHESVVAILNDAELDKVTCRRQHKMGSHLPTTVCQSERERRMLQDESRDQWVRGRACQGPNCNG